MATPEQTKKEIVFGILRNEKYDMLFYFMTCALSSRLLCCVMTCVCFNIFEIVNNFPGESHVVRFVKVARLI